MNFSKTKPDLIESNVDIMVQDATGAKINQPTFSENVCGSLHYWYDNYFKKYFLILLLLVIVILYLLYRYYKNKELKRNKIVMSTQPMDNQDQMSKQIYELLKQKREEKK